MNQPAKPMFPVGSPVGPEDVVDREEYIAQAQVRLLDGKHLCVIGPRRVGKTTVVNELLRRLQEQGTLVALVDLFKVASVREFAESYANACLKNESGLDKTIRALQEVAGQVAPRLKYRIEQAEIELALALSRRDADDYTLLSQALDLGETIATRRGRRLVMALDEFQDVSKLDGAELLKRLRAHFQAHRQVSYIFLGSQQTWMREIFGQQENQPFYRFAVDYPIPDVPRVAWIDYICRKFGERGINVTAELAELVLGYSGGHPMDTMLLCSELYFALLELGSTEPTPTLVKLANERCMALLSRVFDEVWQTLGARRNVQLVAKRLAQGELLYAGGKLPVETFRALSHLLKAGVVVRVRPGNYRFVEPMFAEYVRRL